MGGNSRVAAPFPRRPKGMWRRTYDSLRERAFETEMLADEAFSIRTGRLQSRIDTSRRRRSNQKRSYWR